MSAAPLTYVWTGEAHQPLSRFAKLADRQFVVGEQYRLEEAEERSRKSHDHYFAALQDAWQNLPDDLAMEFTSVERLRKRALIATNWYKERRLVTSSPAEARKMAAFMDRGEDAVVISVAGNVVIERTALSQKMRGPERMRKADFQQSKTDVLDWVAELIRVTPQALNDNAGRAA